VEPGTSPSLVRYAQPFCKSVFMKIATLILGLLILLFASCQERESGISSLDIDDLHIKINSAGVGYDVVDDHTLDSSKGFTYIVALSATNKGSKTVSFNEHSFALFNGDGEKMPAKTDMGSAPGAININAMTHSVAPGETAEVILIYSVKEHGVYRFQIVSPASGTRTWTDFPSS
jgi:hypothetical protein